MSSTFWGEYRGFSDLEQGIHTTIMGGAVSQKSQLWLFSMLNMLSMVRLNIVLCRDIKVDKTPSLLKHKVFWKDQLITGNTGKVITDTMFTSYLISARKMKLEPNTTQPCTSEMIFCFTSKLPQ